MLRPLGRGGQSQVYLAVDERGDHHQPVVVKCLIFHSTDQRTRDEELELFQQEAAILGAVKHPSLPRLVDTFSEEDRHYVVEEQVGSMDLDALMRRRGGRLSVEEVAYLGHHLLSLLDHVHRQSPAVVLRDIKPSNITVRATQDLEIDMAAPPWFIDLTIAVRWSPGQEDAVKMGSPGYAPPEQYRGKSEPRSDLYALAAMMHQMLSGHDPVTTQFALPPLTVLMPDLPRGWETMLRRALSLDVGPRFRTAAEMRQALENLMPLALALKTARHSRAGPSARVVTTAPPRPRRAMTRLQVALALVMAALVILGVLAALGGLPGARKNRFSRGALIADARCPPPPPIAPAAAVPALPIILSFIRPDEGENDRQGG